MAGAKSVKADAVNGDADGSAKKKHNEGGADTQQGAQPEVNIGLVGHVDHGKTTLTEALTGKWTDTHSEEIRRGITIRLGYADAAFYKCESCPEPDAYSTSSTCPVCGEKTVFLRKVSFVDAPGHESLMATMLSGAAIMDGALLLIAANEPCPQPQSREHLTALEIIGVKSIVIVQNKVDLVSMEEVARNYGEIREFVKGTPFEDSPVVPVSAQHRVNVDALIAAIQEKIPTPKRDSVKSPMMFVARSFDVNRPGSNPLEMSGGVLGGAVREGVLKSGDVIEIRPGRKVERAGKVSWHPLTASIVGLQTGSETVSSVGPGGSIGVMTTLDPGIVKADALSGSVVGVKDLPPVWNELKLGVTLLERVVGAKDKLVVEPIKIGENLMLNANSAATLGTVSEVQKGTLRCVLKLPVCAETGSRVTISRMIGSRWRLIGYGVIK
ncbi:translation initiation factor IF-2 subunit gamma [Candidatus Woesearchaeota archaeon]|nr:translation initiation factor IF-2 subunit gamma [Candidatus Woesearchaeota archaeon]